MKTPKRIFAFSVMIFSLLILSCQLAGKAATSVPPTQIPPTTIPGWEKFTSEGIEIWLPESFEGGDLSTDLDLIIQRLRSLGSKYEKIADMIEKNPSLYALWIFDTQIGANNFLTNVAVTKEQVLSTITLDMYLDLSIKNISSLGFITIEQEKVKLEGYEAGRVVLQADEFKAKELLYIIKNKNTMWVITYATGIDEFDTRLPTFEQSAKTINILP
jgi:hypothetical protein